MDYEKWELVHKISYWQRRIIVWSMLYYEFGIGVVSDARFDNTAHELVGLQRQATKEEQEGSTYWYAMYDFEGSTGFHLTARLSEEDSQYLRGIAMAVLDSYER